MSGREIPAFQRYFTASPCFWKCPFGWRERQRGLWWEPAPGGSPGQEFGAGTPRRPAALAPAGAALGAGTVPFVWRIKLALLLSLSLFQQFLPPLSLGSGKHSCPGTAKENTHRRDTRGPGPAGTWWQRRGGRDGCGTAASRDGRHSRVWDTASSTSHRNPFPWGTPASHPSTHLRSLGGPNSSQRVQGQGVSPLCVPSLCPAGEALPRVPPISMESFSDGSGAPTCSPGFIFPACFQLFALR